ncbi:hypothetical protein [Caulobacter segnis]|uniref:hypothetical protein n=1 Tax=Caulobacter segnis TaxID=88688 RepID=UPI0026A167D7|nr:hypothetical protein [Caulobacter segnis]
MTRAIDGLLTRATREQRQDGAVSTDTMMKLAAEGYDLGALETDLNERLSPDQ